MTKIIIFKHNDGFNNIIEDEFEFDDNATDEEINEQYIDWMIELITDYCTWFEKE